MGKSYDRQLRGPLSKRAHLSGMGAHRDCRGRLWRRRYTDRINASLGLV